MQVNDVRPLRSSKLFSAAINSNETTLFFSLLQIAEKARQKLLFIFPYTFWDLTKVYRWQAWISYLPLVKEWGWPDHTVHSSSTCRSPPHPLLFLIGYHRFMNRPQIKWKEEAAPRIWLYVCVCVETQHIESAAAVHTFILEGLKIKRNLCKVSLSMYSWLTRCFFPCIHIPGGGCWA